MTTVSCSGGCGKRVQRGKASAVNPVCLECRRRLRASCLCLWCGRPFKPWRKDHAFCSLSCSALFRENVSEVAS